MTHGNPKPAFNLVTVALAGALTAAAIPATATELDPADRVPHWISKSAFNAMSAAEIYDVDRAQRQGKSVVIEGHTVSQSRAIVDEALGGNAVTRSPASFDQ